MTREVAPFRFGGGDDNGVVEIGDLTLHQAIEADADGRIYKRVWLEGRAVAKVECATMTVGLYLDLQADGEKVGAFEIEPLTIAGEEAVAFRSKNDLRLARNAEAPKIEMRIDATAVHRFETVQLEPLPPTDED